MSNVDTLSINAIRILSADAIQKAKSGHPVYPVPVADFSFSILNQPNNEVVDANSAEILMAIDADLTLISDNGETLTAAKGQSVFVPAYVGHYRIQSAGRVARAFN